jgi:hypothetical protein
MRLEMAITVAWDDSEHSIVLIAFQRPWTWKDFDQAVEQMLSLFNSVHHQVDILFDIRDAGFPPADAITHFKKVAEIDHPNGGLLIFIAPKILVQFINSIVRIMALTFAGSGAFKTPKFIFTKSPEEARAYRLTHRIVKAS